MGDRRGYEEKTDQDGNQDAEAPGHQRSGRALELAVVLAWQVADQLGQIAERLGAVAALKALLELADIESALGVGGAQPLGGPLPIRVGSTEGEVMTRHAMPELLGGHVNFLSGLELV